MNVLVKYIDFHWDNYQGGSGKTVELNLAIEMPDELKCSEFYDFIHKKIDEHKDRARQFKQSHGTYIIKTVECI